MKIKNLLFIFLISFNYVMDGFSQLHVNRKINFDTASTSRTIQGVILSFDSTSAIPLSAFIETRLNYISNYTGSSILNISIPGMLTSYSAGLELFVKALNSNSGAVFLNVNGIGLAEIKRRDTLSLVPNEVAAGEILRLLYNGSYFIIQNPTSFKCPDGFVNANDNFCIEIMERTPGSYLTAVNTCYSINARLCSWGEWYYACQKSSLGLSNMTNNYEYVDDTSDHANTVLIVGNGSCNAHFTNLITNTATFRYRCCYNK